MIMTDLSSAQLRKAAAIKEKLAKLEKELASLVGGKATVAGQPAKRKTISAAGIARIRAAQKARWAKVKKALKS